jgi:hypothetical protein
VTRSWGTDVDVDDQGAMAPRQARQKPRFKTVPLLITKNKVEFVLVVEPHVTQTDVFKCGQSKSNKLRAGGGEAPRNVSESSSSTPDGEDEEAPLGGTMTPTGDDLDGPRPGHRGGPSVIDEAGRFLANLGAIVC